MTFAQAGCESQQGDVIGLGGGTDLLPSRAACAGGGLADCSDGNSCAVLDQFSQPDAGPRRMNGDHTIVELCDPLRVIDYPCLIDGDVRRARECQMIGSSEMEQPLPLRQVHGPASAFAHAGNSETGCARHGSRGFSNRMHRQALQFQYFLAAVANGVGAGQDDCVERAGVRGFPLHRHHREQGNLHDLQAQRFCAGSAAAAARFGPQYDERPHPAENSRRMLSGALANIALASASAALSSPILKRASSARRALPSSLRISARKWTWPSLISAKAPTGEWQLPPR